MAITNTVRNNQVRNTVVGRSVASGTVAAEDVVIGFKPRYVRVVNLTERVEIEWFEGMTAAHALKTVANGTRTHASSAGITVFEKADGYGFTIGTDSDLRPNVLATTLDWLAVA